MDLHTEEIKMSQDDAPHEMEEEGAKYVRFLKWMKADDAINLDGGGSTTLWVNGYAEGGIVNHPSDNRKMEQSAAYKSGMDLDNFPASEKWDRSGERPVANVLIVRRKK